MRYERFVDQRRLRWEAFGEGIDRLRREPRSLSYEELAALATEFRLVLHDHAFAAKRFPGSAAARQLARLTVEGTHALTIDDIESRRGVLAFYRDTFPRLIRLHAMELAVASALFLLAMVLGLSMSAADPDVGASMLGEGAVEGLRQERLWTEGLAESGQAYASSAIARNNVKVALSAWMGGVLAGIPTLWVVALNGFHLGAVISTTAHYGMAAPLFGFVIAHGPLEIALILVAAAAGLRIGRAVIAADVRSRSDRIRSAARDSVALAIGCLPGFFMLGMVEAFVSPAPAVPVEVKSALGLALVSLLLVAALGPFEQAVVDHEPGGSHGGSEVV